MEDFLFEKINGLAGESVCFDALAIFFAEYFGYILAAAVILIFWKKWRIILEVFFASVLARLGPTELIRRLWPRPRPFVENQVNLLLEHSQSASLPSGHAAFFFALSTAVYLHNKKAGICFFIASFLISFSRVFAGIHWPWDILAGAVLGIVIGWLTVKLSKKYTA